MTAPINIRLATADDLPFLVTTFCRSFAEASAYAEGVSKEELAALLTRALLDWPAFVAVAPDDDTTILGYVIGTGNVCAWLYVRPELRKRGLAQALFVHANIEVRTLTTPFATTRARWITDRFRPRFRPFLVTSS